MSFYVTRRQASAGGASPAVEAPAAVAAPLRVVTMREPYEEDWSLLRKATPAEYLLPSTRAWMLRLPAALQPARLVAQYPRLANLIALEWNDDISCRALLGELLAGTRPDREGFPVDIHRELQTLLEHTYRGRRLSLQK